MRLVAVKYLKTDPRTGNVLYRRRVPKALAGSLRATEFVKVLGRTEREAVVAYGPVHQRIEHMVALAKNGVAGLSPREQQTRLKAMLEGWGADPHSPGRDDNERTWREEAAARLIDRYQDPETGEHVDVPEDAGALASALLGGVPKAKPRATIRDAFRFYLAEKAKPIPEQRRKQEQRFARGEKNLIAAVKSDKAVADLTREDARAWRDMRRAAGAEPTTLRREKNDLSAVIAYAIKELDAGGANPFAELTLPAAPVSRKDERLPLPNAVVAGVHGALASASKAQWDDLTRIWTILDFTGARPSEVRQLLVGEIMLDHAVPHIVIQERDDRTLKTTGSTRKVPLVGAALDAATAAVEGAKGPSAPAFPQFHGEGGMDRLSATLNRRIRALTSDGKHVAYSLRHNMADRLRAAEAPDHLRHALLGHSEGKGEAARYGGDDFLDKKRAALAKALAGYRGMPAKPG